MAADQRTPPARNGETEDMLPEREVRFPTSIHWTHRRPLGVGPSTLLAGLAGLTFVFSIVMFAGGAWPAGTVLLAASVSEICLLMVAVRREPESPGARVTRTAAREADGLVQLSTVMVRASTRTGVELARLWHRRARLRMQLRRQLTPLGEAVYQDDPRRASALKAQADRLGKELGDADRRAAEAIDSMRTEIERERATTQATQRLSTAGIGSSESNGERPDGH